MIGVLTISGYTLPDVLDCSFEQIGLLVRCATRARVGMLNAILGPIVGSTGAEFKPGRVKWNDDDAPKGKKPIPTETPELSPKASAKAAAEEVAKLQAMKALGIRVDGM